MELRSRADGELHTLHELLVPSRHHFSSGFGLELVLKCLCGFSRSLEVTKKTVGSLFFFGSFAFLVDIFQFT